MSSGGRLRTVGRLRRDRALGWLAVVVGLGLALAIQLRAPVGVPLYDGVVVVEPYRYLHPVGAQAGNPSSYASTEAIAGGISPVFVAATTESPPQAQLVATQDAFAVPPGTKEIKVSVAPVDATVQPTQGSIAGNVYRFSVTTDAGQALTAKPCDSCRTLVIRAPETVTDGKIAHLEGGTWVEVTTLHAGVAAMFQTNADAVGDFAIIAGSAPGDGTQGGGGLDPLVFGGIALALFFVAVAGLFWYRRRPAPVPVARLGPNRGRIPSKRKGPRRPPSGRSGP